MDGANGKPPRQPRGAGRNWPRHRQRTQAAVRAWRAALKTLIAEHQDEWDRSYRLYAALEGVTARGTEPMTEAELALELTWEIERLKARLLAEGYEPDAD